MNSETAQQIARNLIKKALRERPDPQVVVSLLGRHIHWERPEDEVLDEILDWFLAIRYSLKQNSHLRSASLSPLIKGFQILAQKKEISPESFTSSLLERIILEPDSDEATQGERRPTTKDKILDAALEVFSEKGFHVATVEEVAERAGVGKGTLYRYFANKETLFNEVMRLRLEELENSANAALDGHDDVLTMIRKYLDTYFEFFDRNQRLYRLIAQERLDLGSQVQDLYFKKVMRRIPLLKRKIYEASQQGILKEIDFQTVFFGVMGFVHGVIQKWLASDCSYPLVEELPSVIEVLFHGFVRDSRRECLENR